MTAKGGVSGLAVGYLTFGGLLLWSGITDKPVKAILTSAAHGKLTGTTQGPPGPATDVPANPAPGPVSPGSNAVAGGDYTDSAIANDALRYDGAGYVWGGAPARGIGNWDCSSFVNWVVGHDLGMAIPGYSAGTYTGSVHGPTTLSWLMWGGAATIPRKDCAPGDLCVWQTHMGIAISNTEMISARDAQEGTGVDQINGDVPGEKLFVRRLK